MISASRWLVPAFVVFATLALAVHAEPTPSASPSPSATPAPAATPKPPKTIWTDVRVHEPYIAMTFDDGPSGTLTPKLLDILKERNMHVTFFVVGENAKLHPEILKRAIAEGHEIGNHSWTHPNFAKIGTDDTLLKALDHYHLPHPAWDTLSADDKVRLELTSTSDAIEAAIGKRPTLMRPPYGSFTKEQGKWFHDQMGFTVVLWEVDPNDWKRPGPAVVEQRILQGTHEGSIILSHDIHPGTVEAMPDTFDKLLAKGFKFVTVSELIAMNEPEPTPTPKPSVAPTPTPKPRPSRPPATPRPTVDPNLPKKIDGSAGGL